MAVHLARKHSSRSRSERVAPSCVSRRRIEQLIDYIEAHLDGDLSLESMAAQVNLSPLHLVRVFKAQLGESPHRYIVTRRVERARHLLRDTDTPIAEVALRSGFSSQSHLSSWFRRLVGVPPAAYRRQD
jgi:AraC family transcriptional regulator